MLKRKFSYYNFFVPSDTSPEVVALIQKHRSISGNNYDWMAELGKDLVNYVARPDFLTEAIHYIRTLGSPILYRVTVAFLETITEAQIKSLLEDSLGTNLISELEGWMTLSYNPFANVRGADQDKLSQLFTKIQRVRIPIIANDKRPYVGDMVGADEDMGIDPSISPAPRLSFGSYRFGGNHDGEHWLTKTVGAQIRATAEISGTLLTRYYQGAEQGSGNLANVLLLFG